MEQSIQPQVERSIIKTYRKEIWNRFVESVKRYDLLQEGDKVWPTGIQMQMRERDFGFFFSGIPLEGVEGERSWRKPPLEEQDPEKADGEWNETVIVCKGGKISAIVNGELVNEAVAEATEGYIGFQSEGGPIEFRDIYLMSL